MKTRFIGFPKGDAVKGVIATLDDLHDGQAFRVPAWGMDMPRHQAVAYTGHGHKLQATDYARESISPGSPAPDGFVIAQDGYDVVLHPHVEPGDYEIPITAHVDGVVQNEMIELTVRPAAQSAGWSRGENIYYLEKDDANRFIPRIGEHHRKVHISPTGQSAVSIAAAEGLGPEDITGEWLMDRPHYGATPTEALDLTTGLALWQALGYKSICSHWLLFECGHSYKRPPENIDALLPRSMQGESPRHPVVITSYGSGARPRLIMRIQPLLSVSQPSANILIQNLEFHDDLSEETNTQTGYSLSLRDPNSHHIALDHVTCSHLGGQMRGRGLTLHHVGIWDSYTTVPGAASWVDGVPYDSDGLEITHWTALRDGGQGFLFTECNGLLIDATYVDHAGWQEGYAQDGAITSPLPPNGNSHNLYLQYDCSDVTIRDILTMRAAQEGLKLRAGGSVYGGIFIDNGQAGGALGGQYKDSGFAGWVGHYSLWQDCVVTSGGVRKAKDWNGLHPRAAEGIYLEDSLASVVDTLLIHKANPDDPDEVSEKATGGLIDVGTYLDSRITETPEPPYALDFFSYKWRQDAADTLPQGCDTAVLDQTTIQRWTADRLGVATASIDDLATYVRALDEPASVVPAIMDYFRSAFGMPLIAEVPAAARRLVFQPDHRGDGRRWDNRMNWRAADVPAGPLPAAPDTVDLDGHSVLFCACSCKIDSLLMGAGQLFLTSGHLACAAIERSAHVHLSGHATMALTSGDDLTVHIGAYAQLSCPGPLHLAALHLDLSRSRPDEMLVSDYLDLTQTQVVVDVSACTETQMRLFACPQIVGTPDVTVLGLGSRNVEFGIDDAGLTMTLAEGEGQVAWTA